jgi:hypothetical protein
MGGDVAALFLVAPVSVLAGVLALRRHRAAPVLAVGPSVFALYTYTQLALGGDLYRHPGNSERFFLLFLTLLILGASSSSPPGQASTQMRSLAPPDLRTNGWVGSFCLSPYSSWSDSIFLA